ncbi:MAG: hypothetical protein JXM73_15325, partial [Anaerolineae bacterium]|nr:hypothetical protein [Anaerolineae bacterium]
MSFPSDVREIKERLDLVEIISSYLPLKRVGQNFTAFCPFHADQHTPSFVVFPGSQRWYCFGACNAGGDLFDFVMKWEGWDFRTALEELARRAGVSLRPPTPEEKQVLQERRGYEATLGVAADHFARRLQDTPAARAYAHSRAWSDETIQNEGLGYADGARLPVLGHERAQRVAEALNRWAEKVGGAIVYVHRDSGRVVYLTGRSVEDKHHHNPPGDLAGPRRPYLNTAYSVQAEEIVVVEGQADAITLGGWGIPALALTGSGLSGDLAGRLRQHIESGATIYVAPDADGRTDVAGLAETTGPSLRVVALPDGVHDVNAYAQGGAAAAGFQELLDGAPTWLALEIERVAGVNGRKRRAERRILFERLALLDQFTLADYREAVIQSLGVSADQFNRYLRAVRMESAAGWGNGERYVVEGGRLCVMRYGHDGGGQYAEPLCN